MTDYEDHYPFEPNTRDNEVLPPVEVPPEALSEAALTGLIEAFILREGTDYGVTEISHDTKIGQVRKQLDKGDLKIAFDPNTESVNLLTLRDWKRLIQASQS